MSRDCRVIVFASQKGGSGKTTLSGHVAVEAERRGYGPVALIDTDPQGSLAKWWNARRAEAPAFAHIRPEELEEGVEHLKRAGFALIVCDTPPAASAAIHETVRHADLVVVPTRPSPHDLRAVGPTVDIIESLGRQMVFVVNSASSRARITSETAIALSQHGVVAPVTVHNRVDFAASMIDGRTVGEVRAESKSAEEITALWRYLGDRLYRQAGGRSEAGMQDFATASLSPASASDPDSRHVFEEVDEAHDEAVSPAALALSPASSASSGLGPEMKPAPDTRPNPELTRARPGSIWPASSARRPDAAPHAGAAPEPIEPPEAVNTNWDGVERRQADQGPPAGQAERRRVFGRRAATGFAARWRKES